MYGTDCEGIPAGLEDGSVTKSQFSASSSYLGGDWASRARLNNVDSYWASDNPATKEQWIQIDLVIETPVKGIISQGSGTRIQQWVKTYQVLLGNDEARLNPIRQSGSIKVSVSKGALTQVKEK